MEYKPQISVYPSEKGLVSPTAEVSPRAKVAFDASIGDLTRVSRGSEVGNQTVVGSGVKIGRKAIIGNRCLLLDGASVAATFAPSQSSDARVVRSDSIIGNDVVLGPEVEVGSQAIIPSQQTIVELGKFGRKNRVVTIYGGLHGPRISIGCNVGATMDVIEHKIGVADNTTDESANEYAPFMHTFREIGVVVQRNFEREMPLVDELIAMRQEIVVSRITA